MRWAPGQHHLAFFLKPKGTAQQFCGGTFVCVCILLPPMINQLSVPVPQARAPIAAEHGAAGAPSVTQPLNCLHCHFISVRTGADVARPTICSELPLSLPAHQVACPSGCLLLPGTSDLACHSGLACLTRSCLHSGLAATPGLACNQALPMH